MKKLFIAMDMSWLASILIWIVFIILLLRAVVPNYKTMSISDRYSVQVTDWQPWEYERIFKLILLGTYNTYLLIEYILMYIEIQC